MFAIRENRLLINKSKGCEIIETAVVTKIHKYYRMIVSRLNNDEFYRNINDYAYVSRQDVRYWDGLGLVWWNKEERKNRDNDYLISKLREEMDKGFRQTMDGDGISNTN